MGKDIIKGHMDIVNKGIGDALKVLKQNTKHMEELEEYRYLEGRFNKAMDFGEMEEGTKAYYMFRAIIKRLAELEIVIKED